ncbi:MAG: transcription termination factor Rho, partial [SAR202 cluster bacterium]|nr:transcription termination factor Rho [SAR202 cluster bacterium]
GCKLTTGGLAMEALVGPKEFFGAARQLRESGSLTILATALVDTGTRMDGFIFEEFKGTGNMEVHLSRQLVERQVWPAIDISASGTRREELLLDADEMQRVRLLRKALSRTDPADAMELLINRLGRAGSNAEFLFSISLDS